MNEIKVRQPKPIKLSGVILFFNSFLRKSNEWKSTLPNNGDKIKITWFPDNHGETNAYIGMSGVVEDINKAAGYFTLNCGNSLLICHGDFNYIKLTP